MKASAAIYLETLGYFMSSSTETHFADTNFMSDHDLAPAHVAESTSTCFNDDFTEVDLATN